MSPSERGDNFLENVGPSSEFEAAAARVAERMKMVKVRERMVIMEIWGMGKKNL